MADDIRDLLGRYATGSLSAEEQKRLFDAALDDQEIFDQLAQEQDLKNVLDEPGARDRIVRALHPPSRRKPWILALAPIAAVMAIMMVIMLRPSPKPPQVVAVTQAPAPDARPSDAAPSTEIAQTPPAAPPAPSSDVAPEGRASGPAPAPAKAKAAPPPEAENRVADRKEEKTERDELKKAEPAKQADQPAPSPPPQVVVAAEQASPGGPRQQQTASAIPKPSAPRPIPALPARSALLALPFGFHYSVETKGHLVIIPAADGYLSVKSEEGDVLFDLQSVAAGTTEDIPLPQTHSVSITFSANSSPVTTTPTVQTAVQGTAAGARAVAIQLQLK